MQVKLKLVAPCLAAICPMLAEPEDPADDAEEVPARRSAAQVLSRPQ
jgi:hypothetical protein